VGDLSILAAIPLTIGPAWLAWAITRNHYLNRNAQLNHALTVTAADRNHLLAALGHLAIAVHDPRYNLERAVQQAEKAVDGRWTP
jgi:hypothetical protein